MASGPPDGSEQFGGVEKASDATKPPQVQKQKLASFDVPTPVVGAVEMMKEYDRHRRNSREFKLKDLARKDPDVRWLWDEYNRLSSAQTKKTKNEKVPV